MKEIDDFEQIKHHVERTKLQLYFKSDIYSLVELFFFEKGELLITEGIGSKKLFFLVKGKVASFSTVETGKYIPCGYSQDFRALGEVASLWGKIPVVGVQSVEPCWCLAIDLDTHRETLFDDNIFLRYMCNLLSESVMKLDNNLAHLMSRPIEARLASFIMQNSKKYEFQCSLLECSEQIATSYRHLLRMMNVFCRRGLLKKEGQTYYIIDESGLRNLCADEYIYYD